MNRPSLNRAISFIDSWLPYRYQRLEMPGFVVAIAHDNDVLFEKAYGFADLENKTLMSTEHIFRIASHSKTFAATAIMQLAENDKLQIDDPVVKHIPWLANHRDARMNNVTLRQLLSHSAGIIRDGSVSNYWALQEPFWSEEQFKQQMLKTDLVFDNCTQMKYSNVGYTLIGTVIEQVSGLTFKQYAQKNIIDRLNLKNTGPEYDEKILDNLVTGYSRRGADKQRLPITKKLDTMSMSSATGFYSTASELCKYLAAHLTGSGKLLNDQSKKEMQRPQWAVQNSKDHESYGLGFCLMDAGLRKTFGHGGGFPGQITRSLCDGKEKLTVIVLTNCIDGEAKTTAKGIFSVIDHFENSDRDGDKAQLEKFRRFQGRFMNLWTEVEVVENGRNLLLVNPNTWTPFSKDQDIERLSMIDDTSLKIDYADGYSAEGESLIYDFDAQGIAKSVRCAGNDLLPEADYYKSFERIKNEAAVVCVPAASI